jgi:hypothetical protein
MAINLYVGDVSEYLSVIAKQSDQSAKLIDSTNYQNLSVGTYYTSVGDLDTLTHFGSILQQANNIFYKEPAVWSDIKIKHWTEEYLRAFLYSADKVIHGFQIDESKDKSTILSLIDTRKSNTPQIWNVGCSNTVGVGVNKDQRYGKLIGNYFDLPVSFLAEIGSSLKWQADQILRSDIKKDDILIWGLTGIHRTAEWSQSTLKHHNISTSTNHKILEQLSSDQMIYDAVISIYQVLNFCNKIDCKIILASLLASGIESYVHDCKNFIGLQYQFGRNSTDCYLDVGSDHKHPGPLTHQYYAQEIIKKYHSLYGNNK